MSNLHQLREILGTLHDGTIVAWVGDYSRLTLTVDCQYLAEQRQPDFTLFYVELTNVSLLSLEVWADNEPIRHGPATSFEGELEMASATLEADCVLVTCYQFNQELPYRGGNLRLACATAWVFDQAHASLTMAELKQLAVAGGPKRLYC